jgi:hypothetical protein
MYLTKVRKFTYIHVILVEPKAHLVPQLVIKLSALYGSEVLITVSTRVCLW